MYKPTNPQQTLFGIDTQLSTSLCKRLQSSWAYFFKVEVLPILFRNEDQYALLYGKTGRPNFSRWPVNPGRNFHGGGKQDCYKGNPKRHNLIFSPSRDKSIS